jgi:hypothetical protein
LFNSSRLTAGTGVFIADKTSWTKTLTGVGDVTGRFTGNANTVTINTEGNAQEVQRVFLGGATGGVFTLSIDKFEKPDGTLATIQTTSNITVGSASVTAANIKTELELILLPLLNVPAGTIPNGTALVKVTSVGSGTGAFDIQFLKPTYANVPQMTLNTNVDNTLIFVDASIALNKAGQNILDAGVIKTHTNGSFTIDLGMAEKGIFNFSFGYKTTINGTVSGVQKTPTISVTLGDTLGDTALEIQRQLATNNISAMVTMSVANKFKVEIVNPEISDISVTQSSDISNGSLKASPAIWTSVEGSSVREVKSLILSNATQGDLTLSIGSYSQKVTLGDATTTLANLKNAMNNLQKSFLGFTYKAEVRQLSFTDAHKEWEITFTNPGESNVADMTVDVSNLLNASGASNNVLGRVVTLEEGSPEGSLQAIETIVAANADTKFLFSSGNLTDMLKALVIPEKIRKPHTLTIDTSLLTANDHVLDLDFSQVADVLNFNFEQSGAQKEVKALTISSQAAGEIAFDYAVNEKQRLTLSDTQTPSGTFKLTLTDPNNSNKTVTTAAITVVKDPTTQAVDVYKTAQNIEIELNKLTGFKTTDASGANIVGANTKLSVSVKGVTKDGVAIKAGAEATTSYKPNTWDIVFNNKQFTDVGMLTLTDTSLTAKIDQVRQGVKLTTENINLTAGDKVGNGLAIQNALNQKLGEGAVTVKIPKTLTGALSTASTYKYTITFNQHENVELVKSATPNNTLTGYSLTTTTEGNATKA